MMTNNIVEGKSFYIDKLYAATHWKKYDPSDIICPEIGEWCLWSVILPDSNRNYFAGRIFEREADSKAVVRWDGYKDIDIDNTLYFARVSKMIFDDER